MVMVMETERKGSGTGSACGGNVRATAKMGRADGGRVVLTVRGAGGGGGPKVLLDLAHV